MGADDANRTIRAEWDKFGVTVWRVYRGERPIATFTTIRSAKQALKKLQAGKKI